MSTHDTQPQTRLPAERLIMIAGGYGSGKTEVSVNLAIQLAKAGRTVRVVDLDIVNPYFRCREARALMEAHGIRVVVPPGAQAYADLPIILPEIAGMFQPGPGTVNLFDIGGDDVGARSLASFRTRIGDRPYELWQVINGKRPFTGDVAGCLKMQAEIEAASRLRITGLLVNTHLIQETTPEAVLEGWQLGRAVSEENGLPMRYVAAMSEFRNSQTLAPIDVPFLWLKRYMLPPWLVSEQDSETKTAGSPAARPAPIGIPGEIRIGRNKGDHDGQHSN